ncbi:MAG: glucokinase [Clostridia bacterium]|nr:MAG: glucokinase [Clostridia bacterium]
MYRVGIDLGGTNIVAGVVNDRHEIVAFAKCKTACPRPSEEIVADMARMTREAVKKAGITMDEVKGVGVGSPGVCNKDTGVVERAANLGFENLPICAMLSEMLGKKVYIENDANAAALGEFIAGAAKDVESCVCITLGTGVGGGVIIDGKVFAGSNFAGTELGHTVIVVDGEPCSCGRRGCWEAYASATGLIRQTRRAMEEHRDSKMWNIAGSLDKVDGRTPFEAMRAGDAAGKAVVDRYIYYIAVGLINMINIFQPEVLCVGGGICKEGETLLAPLRKYIDAEQFSKYSEKKTKLCVAALGNDAGIIGAAGLVE